MTHIIALSGGKDSTAMALRLAETTGEDYIYVCNPTGDEPDEMIEHWNKLSDMLGKKILPVTSGVSLNGLIKRYNALPNHRMRWCTRILKIEPFQRFLLQNLPCTIYVGLRADEEQREGGVYGHIEGVEQRFPLREWGWGIQDVKDYLVEKGVTIPYRTDCLRCYAQQLGEWWNLWSYTPERYAEAEQQEVAAGHTFRSETSDSWPASLTELRQRFEGGDVPSRSKSLRHQLTLFDEYATERGKCRVCSL